MVIASLKYKNLQKIFEKLNFVKKAEDQENASFFHSQGLQILAIFLQWNILYQVKGSILCVVVEYR